ncbi:hypothetical protein [Pseudomonas sp. Au-Pse12]|uniref:hypothetical protein n=1 Tax=Pseudomonas sp. Au-Pse12 TaxID=2906459 RepID=UPI001E3CE328|nr:hypothetical protein [Pseudomonas sp. Au-Pse12]MCE4055674.1 hypothetical protein [Pseudomonas sp. Au-Pse12]
MSTPLRNLQTFSGKPEALTTIKPKLGYAAGVEVTAPKTLPESVSADMSAPIVAKGLGALNITSIDSLTDA